jgi:UDP-N-acetylglucosamine:LPS N-acetylglucosamine transferase
MATQGIRESLPDCKFHVVDAYNEPLRALDVMKYIDSELSFEKFFNSLAKHEKYGLLNLLGKIGEHTLPAQRKQFEHLLLKYMKKEINKDKPDLIISCIPMINPALATIGKKLNIPVLVVTTDLDIVNFTAGLKQEDCAIGKKHFRITAAYDKQNWENILGKKIPGYVKDIIDFETGYPTRRAFSVAASAEKVEEIRRTYQIQPDENVACVMMGGNTAEAAKNYAKHLLSMNEQQIEEICGQENTRKKIRLICLCGDIKDDNNRRLMEKLNALNQMKKANHNVTIHAAPGTPKIAELVSPPEFFAMISKPGGSTIGEMIKKRVPMIYHVTGQPISWESGNMAYGEDRQLGKTFKMPKKITEKSKDELVSVLKEARIWREEIINGTKAVPEADHDFSLNLRRIVGEMVS